MSEAYVEIEVVSGPKFRGYDNYVVPWIGFGSMVAEYMDSNSEATLKFTIRYMTEEAFEAICENL